MSITLTKRYVKKMFAVNLLCMLKSGTPHGPFSILGELIAQNKTIRIIQTGAAIDRNFKTFLPEFLKNTCEKVHF